MSPGGLRVRLLASDDASDAALQREFFAACETSVAQQTPAWSRVIAGLGQDEPLTLGCFDGSELVGVLPAFRFEGPLGAVLNSVPQAGPLGGVACRGDSDPVIVYGSLLDAYLALAKDRGCALASLITNPFWPDREHYARREADFELENRCLVLDLDEPVDDAGLPASASAHVRRNLRRAEAAGFVIDEEQRRESVEAWYAIHAERHRAIGAVPLPRDLFLGALEHAVPADLARFFFVRSGEGGEIVAGGFYVFHGGAVDALMPSVGADAARRGANYRLADHTIRWSRTRGLRYYNWQASPPESGVARFKRQWGSGERSYSYLTWITGDARPWLESTPGEVREGYRWHYTVPFDRIGGPETAGGPSQRDRAWRAAELGE